MRMARGHQGVVNRVSLDPRRCQRIHHDVRWNRAGVHRHNRGLVRAIIQQQGLCPDRVMRAMRRFPQPLPITAQLRLQPRLHRVDACRAHPSPQFRVRHARCPRRHNRHCKKARMFHGEISCRFFSLRYPMPVPVCQHAHRGQAEYTPGFMDFNAHAFLSPDEA